jgi:hypothetical protein
VSDKSDAATHGVTERSYVVGPMISHQAVERRDAPALDWEVIFLCIDCDEALQEKRDVLTSRDDAHVDRLPKFTLEQLRRQSSQVDAQEHSLSAARTAMILAWRHSLRPHRRLGYAIRV